MSDLPMSAGEVVVTLLSAVLAIGMWVRWYLVPARLERLGAPRSGRAALGLAPALCAVLLLVVLLTLASHDVRDDIRYIGMYLAVGAAWVAVSTVLLPLVGLSVRDDVLERGNAAAAYAIAGALLGVTLAFAGGNVGDGPGWWVVVFSAGLATGTLYVLWLALEQFAEVSEQVTIERDHASGVRLAGFLVACGLVVGRAAAGDWVSVSATIADFFRVAIAAVGLLAIAIAIELRARPSAARPVPALARWGLIPAGLYVVLAGAYVARLGIPE